MNWLNTSARCPPPTTSSICSSSESIFADGTSACSSSTRAACSASWRSSVSDRRIVNRLWLTSPSRPRTFCRSRCRWVWYSLRCRGCSSTSRTCSCFSGRSAATCSLVRRMISGRIRRRSWPSSSVFADLLDRARVVLLEPLRVREQPRRGDRQQRPQLHQVVLHRRAGDRHLERCGDLPRARVRLGVVVLHVLRLVEHQPRPGERPVRLEVQPQQGVRRHHRVRPRDHRLERHAAPGQRVPDRHHLQVRGEPARLRRPVRQHARRRDDEERIVRNVLA